MFGYHSYRHITNQKNYVKIEEKERKNRKNDNYIG